MQEVNTSNKNKQWKKHVRTCYLACFCSYFQISNQTHMKRRRIDMNEKPAKQFDALRNIRGMTNAARREVVAAYTTTATRSGARAASRAQHVFPHSRESLRSMRLPMEPGSEDLEVWYFSLLQHLAAKVDSCAFSRAALRHCLQKRSGRKSSPSNVLCQRMQRWQCGGSGSTAQSPSSVYQLIDMPLLGRDSLWLTMAVFRTADMQRTASGITGATRALLEAWRKESEAGIPLDVGTGPELCWVHSVVLLADAEALRAISGTKGASGTKPCLKCANVLSHRAAANEIAGHYSIAESNYQLLQLTNVTGTLRRSPCTHRIASLRTKKQVSEAETLLGWNLHATQSSCLCSPILRPWLDVTQRHFDSIHIYYSNGIVGQEIGYWWGKILDTTSILPMTLFFNMCKRDGNSAPQEETSRCSRQSQALEKRRPLPRRLQSNNDCVAAAGPLPRRNCSSMCAAHGWGMQFPAGVGCSGALRARMQAFQLRANPRRQAARAAAETFKTCSYCVRRRMGPS